MKTNKIVSESLYSFEKKSNHLDSLGVGQIALIKKWLKENYIKEYTINDDLNIDVKEDVHLDGNDLVVFPDYIQFNIVNGHFSIAANKLTSLRGCPLEVKGWFECDHNNLTSLKYSPKIIEGSMDCSYNYLKEIKEGPEIIRINFYCEHQKTNVELDENQIREIINIKGSVHVS
jgi:hypothetical protein